MNEKPETPHDIPDGSSMTRGQLLKRATAAELALLAAFAPVGVADAARAVLRRQAATPKRGGTLKIGVIGNGTSETFNPAVFNSPIDFLHGISTFDPLVRFGPNFDFQPGLAVRWVPNKTATAWEIHLRQGVKWHDGKPFTADDVIYSLRQMGSTSHFGHFAVAAVDLKGLQKKGNYIVHMPMTSPRGVVVPLFSFVNTMIVQNGAKNFTKPIGTGPFMLQSFTPGQQSTAKANPDYWDHGKPYVDELQITSISDPSTSTDAIESGQFDAAYPVIFPLAAAKQKSPGSGNWNLVVQKGGFHQTIYMRADQAPFNDARVRLAMKLIPEREKMIDTVLSGFGEVGNDLIRK
jgi:peptide/nickel transport system substrate-binding protein